MKNYWVRLLCANVLIVVALGTLVLLVIGRYVIEFSATVSTLLPFAAIVVSTCAFAFALLEAIILHKTWKSLVESKDKSAESQTDK